MDSGFLVLGKPYNELVPKLILESDTILECAILFQSGPFCL